MREDLTVTETMKKVDFSDDVKSEIQKNNRAWQKAEEKKFFLKSLPHFPLRNKLTFSVGMY